MSKSTSKQQVCDYCGKIKGGPTTFLIGAGKADSISPVDGERSWCMHYGTGKMTCPDCHAKGETEGTAAVDQHVEDMNQAF